MTQPYTGLGNKPTKMSSFHFIRDIYLLIIGTLCVLAIIGCWNQLVQMNEKDKFVDVSENNALDRPPPPPKSDAARYARYIVHYSDWCAVAHTSHQPGTNGYPMSRIYSMVDGTLSNSSGTPYLYISAMDEGVQDLMFNDSRCSVTISLAEGSFCHVEEFDPEDPRCPQVTLTGRFQVVKNNTEEYQWAKKSMFSRHPQMMNWPKGHHFFLAKVNVENILLVNNVGGNKYPSVSDYFKADPVPRDTVYDQVVKKYL